MIGPNFVIDLAQRFYIQKGEDIELEQNLIPWVKMNKDAFAEILSGINTDYGVAINLEQVYDLNSLTIYDLEAMIYLDLDRNYTR